MDVYEIGVYFLMVVLFACLVISYIYLTQYQMITATFMIALCTFIWIVLTCLFFSVNPEHAIPFLFINQGMVMFFSLYSFAISYLYSTSLK
jgi:hypothetical protein